MNKHRAIISLGSNLGNRLELLQKALALVEAHSIKILALSSIYETPAWGFESTPFYNACVQIETHLKPDTLLKTLLQIEVKLGRTRESTKGYEARPIDLDLLFYDNLVLSSDHLVLPHPSLHLRNFVLTPLVEIAPDWRHPVLDQSVSQLLAQSSDQDHFKKIPFQKWTPPIFDLFPYLVVEGNIGVGKTTLAQKIASTYNVPYIQETFAKNPYLEKFYSNPTAYALDVESFFLEDRVQQLQHFWNQNNLRAVSDYNIQKSLLFASQNLSKSDFLIYEKRFKKSKSILKKPDLMVYLHTDIKSLQVQIKKRGRPYEKHIKTAYLENIESGYQKLIALDLPYPVVSIATKNLDFESNETDFQSILRAVFQASFL